MIEFHIEEQLSPWDEKELDLSAVDRVIRRQLAGWDNSIQACVVIDKVFAFSKDEKVY